MSLNLCQELVKEAERIELDSKIVNYIRNNNTYIECYNKDSGFQRVMLTTILFKLLMSPKVPVPSSIRVYLNSANDSLVWLDDIKLAILPFIKENEGVFCSTIA